MKTKYFECLQKQFFVLHTVEEVSYNGAIKKSRSQIEI